MKFTRKGEWWMQSTCGTYRISKGLVMGTPWYLVHKGHEIIGDRHPDSKSAIAAAEEHARDQRRTPVAA